VTQEPQQRPPGTEAAMDRRPDHGEQSYRGHGRLAGKATVVTGGDSGIGKAVAIAFARVAHPVRLDRTATDVRVWDDSGGGACRPQPARCQQQM
jgi:hypothetical protein